MFGNKPGQRIIDLAETDSTNSFAARLLHDEIPEEGTVIITGFQKSGRGQRGAAWESEKGKNLLISYILYPTFLPIHLQFYLTQCVSLALLETLQNFTSVPVQIKWPNDILAGGKKIAGVLIETAIRNDRMIHAIAGAGININQERFGAYSPEATSLLILENKTFDLFTILRELNNSLHKWYTILRLGHFDKITEAYTSNLFLFRQESNFESQGERFEGTITGVQTDGTLLIMKDDQTVLNFRNKEVKFLF
jgi:BirA family transcriptional regulator, biotin operon repressor / biotin---[acetyl-CoA-carboxylase] ligase